MLMHVSLQKRCIKLHENTIITFCFCVSSVIFDAVKLNRIDIATAKSYKNTIQIKAMDDVSGNQVMTHC